MLLPPRPPSPLDVVFQSNYCFKMPFPTHVFVSLNKEGTFSSPPKEFREKMMAALKDFFDEKLEEEPWSDLEATLWYVVQRLPLFKERRMMVKLRNISDDRENGEFNFKVFLCKRPEVYPTWNGESDEEEAPPEVYFCMEVSVKIVPMDSLQKSCGFLVAKMNPDELLVEGKPMPKRLLSFVKDLASKDYT